MIARVAPGTGSIVSVAGPAMMIGLMNSAGGGLSNAAVRTGALIGVGVGLGIGVGVGVAVGVDVGVAVGEAVGVGVAVAVGLGGIVGVGVGLGGGSPASMTPRD